jgi:hypothetical protein
VQKKKTENHKSFTSCDLAQTKMDTIDINRLAEFAWNYCVFHNLNFTKEENNLNRNLRLRKLTSSIPLVIITHILTFLKLQEQALCWLVSRTWFRTKEDPKLWENAFQEKNYWVSSKIIINMRSTVKSIIEVYSLVKIVNIRYDHLYPNSYIDSLSYFSNLTNLTIPIINKNHVLQTLFDRYACQLQILDFFPSKDLDPEVYAMASFDKLELLKIHINYKNIKMVTCFLEHLEMFAPKWNQLILLGPHLEHLPCTHQWQCLGKDIADSISKWSPALCQQLKLLKGKELYFHGIKLGFSYEIVKQLNQLKVPCAFVNY